MTTVAVVSVGRMGATIGQSLVKGGAEVLTSLDGRSAASAERARANGFRIVRDDAELAAADIFLSIVPPINARETAERFLPHLAAAARPALYVECNAIAPDTSRELAALFADAALPFADGAIIGRTDALSALAPRLYLSGAAVATEAVLRDCGLDCRHLSDRLGAASELKMVYSALTKGFQAMATLVALTADTPDLRDRLVSELRLSQPELYGWLGGRLPDMIPKAFRWDVEMQEIAAYLDSRGLDSRMFDSAAQLFHDLAGDDEQIAKINLFLGR